MKQDNTKKKFRVSFKDAHPDKAKYWDFTKNKLNPDQVSKVDEREFWFICEANHPFSLLPKSINRYESWCTTCDRLKKSKQPPKFSVSFKDAHPIKAKYWDYNKNQYGPDDVGQWDLRKFWFICENGHPFDQKPSAISGLERWCRFCENQEVPYEASIASTHPEIARQWHPTKNKKTSSEVSIGSNTLCWWLCPEGSDHEWEATPNSRKKNGCSICSGHTVVFSTSLAGRCPELIEEIDIGKTSVDPKKIYHQSTKILPWKCRRCSHKWSVPVRSRTYAKTGCRKCSTQTSMPELRVFTELQHLFPDAERRSKLDGKEADIYIPSLKTVIEYDGSYYHKNLDAKDKEKTEIFEALGLTLIRVREEPLDCSKLDVQVPKRLAKLEPSHVRQILDSIEIDNPSISDIAKVYADKNEFVADEEYRRLISYLPAPPPEESLAEKKPELAKEWNYEKNHPLTPEMFYPRSGSRVWWICHKGCEWDATIDKRTGGKNMKSRGCPYCRGVRVGYGNSLADSYPEVAKWWFQPLNEEVTPSDVVFGSGERHWFTCENNHVRKRRVVDLTTDGKKCGHCPGPGRGRKYTRPKELDQVKGY